MNSFINRAVSAIIVAAGIAVSSLSAYGADPHMPVKKHHNTTDTIADAPAAVEVRLGEAEVTATLPDSIAAMLDESPYDRWEPRETEFNPDPTRAVWMSALFPGLGQSYTRLGFATPWNNGMLNDYTRAYRDIMDNDPSTNSYMNFFPPTTQESDLDRTWLTNILQSRKNFYRRNRDLCIISMIGVYWLARRPWPTTIARTGVGI